MLQRKWTESKIKCEFYTKTLQPTFKMQLCTRWGVQISEGLYIFWIATLESYQTLWQQRRCCRSRDTVLQTTYQPLVGICLCARSRPDAHHRKWALIKVFQADLVVEHNSKSNFIASWNLMTCMSEQLTAHKNLHISESHSRRQHKTSNVSQFCWDHTKKLHPSSLTPAFHSQWYWRSQKPKGSHNLQFH